MPFENSGTLQKWHLTKTPTEIDKYDPHKNSALQMRYTLQKMPKVYPICQELSWLIFESKFLNMMYDSDLRSWDPLQNDIPGTLLCLIVVGVVSISRVLVVLQKTNNVGLTCHLCWVPFLGGSMFDKRSALYVTLC